MDHLTRLITQTKLALFFGLILCSAVLIGASWGLQYYLGQSPLEQLLELSVVALVGSYIIANALTVYVTQPIKLLWQSILHISPYEHGVGAPKIEDLKIGRELVANLSAQVFQLASMASGTPSLQASQPLEQYGFIATNLPLPLFVLDDQQTILFANPVAAAYIGQAPESLVGKNVYMVLDMSFPSENTLDSWLKTVQTSSATAVNSWERVRMNVLDNHPTRLFDLAAYYNKDNPNKQETILVLFDHTKQYSQDDQAISFIALSVHELRTPLTLLRGYIEAFEEELAGQLTPQMEDFMQKMSATAQQLTAFVNNILNVARIDDDQLQLQLQEEDWPTIIQSVVANLSLRAKVRGITLQTTIAPNLPKVGVDRLSIHEVLNNLIDNAIKYSNGTNIISIDTHLTQDGLVETSVQDYGLGIGTAIMPNLFTKFYRDHRNRAQIGGTGLGLYLCKAIVTAHGGNIWVRSQEGKGSTFGFTLLPYERLAEEIKNSDNKDIVRGAHGWIKNHSLYRR